MSHTALVHPQRSCPDMTSIPGLEEWADDVLFRLSVLSDALLKSQAHRGEELVFVAVPSSLASEASSRGDSDGTTDIPLHYAIELFDEAMYQATAVVVFREQSWDPLSHTTSSMYGKLIDAIVWGPVKVWKATAMQTALACWAWLVSERPDAETRLMHAMQLAWNWSIRSNKGLFCTEHGRDESSEAVFNQEAPTSSVLSRTPVLWIAYLSSRFSVVAKRSSSQAQLVTAMVLEALDHAPRFNRHFSAVTARLGCVLLRVSSFPSP